MVLASTSLIERLNEVSRAGPNIFAIVTFYISIGTVRHRQAHKIV